MTNKESLSEVRIALEIRKREAEELMIKKLLDEDYDYAHIHYEQIKQSDDMLEYVKYLIGLYDN